ncbi:MAG: tetratricopeptide repeat protein [Candidatus Manganitrophus sp.]|nr:tetratricopeptide repeat protein [Candidatus Manganitrophus sp.]WDT72816.1 MAG: tetratricopeptide repeat protein [Candidatus Manganitrophus sp.]WDT79698.1 MAG: tetratricopeptide repeat protein [Candidatus Manganitrophus sp.]
MFYFTKWMVFFLLLFASFSFVGCQKQDGMAENVGAGAPPPVPSAPAPVGEAASSSASAESPHGSGAPVPFMQKLAEYKARLEKDPKDIEALVFMGNANYDIQRFEKAKEFYQKALEVDPNNTHVRTDLASSYRSLGETDQALEELNKVLKSDPKHEVALYNSGIILLNDKNDAEKATAAWEKLVQLKPNDPLSQELKKKISELKQTGSPSTPSATQPK